MSEWKPISSAPRDGAEILVSDQSGNRCISYYDCGLWWAGNDEYGNPEFIIPWRWQPLPPPPEVE
jgi:hypothetical protein